MPVDSAADCKDLAESCGMKWEGNETDASVLKGCFMYYNDGVYWNDHAVGSADSGSKPVCKAGEQRTLRASTAAAAFHGCQSYRLSFLGQIMHSNDALFHGFHILCA